MGKNFFKQIFCPQLILDVAKFSVLCFLYVNPTTHLGSKLITRRGHLLIFIKMKKKSLKPDGQMLRGVAFRLIESIASKGNSSIWKLICAISVCNTLTVGVHLSSTPSISGPGSATDHYSRNGNLSTLILMPTLPKPTAYFSVISSSRERARVCDMENVYAMPMYLFLITGSEHDETIWAGAYHKYDQREPALLCNLVRVTMLTNSKFLDG